MKTNIKEIIGRYFKIKVFSKLLTIYSLVIVVSLFALTFFVFNNINISTKNTELDTNRKILDSVSNYLINKNNIASNIFYQIYSNQDIQTDMNWYLKYDYDRYLTKRLDKYSNSPYFGSNDTESFISYNFNTDPDIESIVLHSSVKNTFSVFHSNNIYSLYNSKSQYLHSKTVKNIIKLPGNTTLTERHLYQMADKYPPYSITHTFTDSETKEIIGNILINYSFNSIKHSYSRYKHQLLGYILVLTPDGTIIYDSSNKHSGKYKHFKLLKSKTSSITYDKNSYINVNTSNPNAIIVGIIPKSELFSKSFVQLRTVIIIAFLLILAAIIFIFWSLRSYSKRTENIMSAMAALQKGNLSTRIPLGEKYEDELTIISQSFNNMCDNLNSYIEKVYLLELKQKDAELVALQAQVNPHFLYNTLESIRMRAISQGSSDVGDLLYILATFFRNSIKRKMIISISEELNNCNLYLELFKIRYENKLDYSVDIAPDARNCSIIKLTVQPIIENYIVHGINFVRTDNFISIKVFLKDDTVNIMVSDNGKGINEETLENIRNSLKDPSHNLSDSMGIVNVNERIKYKYGSQYGLDIVSTEKKGTCVTIRIPILKMS